MKKLIILILTVLLMLSLLVACNTETPDESSVVPNESSEVTPNESSEIPNESSDITDESSRPDDTAIIPENGNIDFTAHAMYGMFGDHINNVDSFTTVLVTDKSQIEELVTQYENGTRLDKLEEFAEALPEDYFDKNALIIFNAVAGSGSIGFEVEKIYLEDEDLTVTVSCIDSGLGASALSYYIYAVEIARNDIANVKNVKSQLEDQRWYTDVGFEPNGTEIGSEAYIFGGALNGGIHMPSSSHIGRFRVISNKYDLNDFLEIYDYKDVGADFAAFTENLADDYFENKVIIAAPLFTAVDEIDFGTVTVSEDEYGLEFLLEINRISSSKPENRKNILIIEIDRGHLAEKVNFEIYTKFN